jgi:hypothetical protein
VGSWQYEDTINFREVGTKPFCQRLRSNSDVGFQLKLLANTNYVRVIMT